MPNNQPTSTSANALARGHEPAAPNVRNVLIVAASTAALVVFSLALAAIAIVHFARHRPMRVITPLGLLTAPNLDPLSRFPKPNLQIDDGHADAMTVRGQNANDLSRYTWLDRSNGVIAIPIDRAMDLIVQRGLPVSTNLAARAASSPLQLLQERPTQR